MRLGCVLAVGKRAFTCDMWRKVASRSSPESSKINEWNLDSSSHESIKSCGKRHSKRAGILLLFLLLFSEDFSENSLTLSSIRSGKRHSTRACWLNTVDKATLNFGRIALFKLITIYANLNFIHSFYTPQSGFMWLESRPPSFFENETKIVRAPFGVVRLFTVMVWVITSVKRICVL